jgi:hypothetical protein
MFTTLSLTLSAFSSSYPCHAHHKHAGKKCSTLPLRLLLPKTDALYKIICMHCYSASMLYLQAILSIQVVLAIMLIFGYRTRLASIGSWVLYLSLTLRNTWLNFILDRCVEYLFGWCRGIYYLYHLLTIFLLLVFRFYTDTFTTCYFTPCSCRLMGHGQWMPRSIDHPSITTIHLSLQRLHSNSSSRGYTLMRVIANTLIHYRDGRLILLTSFARWTLTFVTRQLLDTSMDCSDRRDCDT